MDGDEDDRSGREGRFTSTARDDEPSNERPGKRSTADPGTVRWLLRSDDGTATFVRDVVSGVAIVAAIGLLLFAISGIWPPLVAVESGSMEPNMERGDLIFVVDDDRFVGDDPVEGTGVVTADTGQENGHETFGEPGDVIVFAPDGNEHRTPVIHRAHYWVEEGENWVDTRADEDVVGDATCEEVATCPAGQDGFITKGDNNDYYDQYRGGANTDVVAPEWIEGKAQFRIPWLGYIRLFFDGLFGAAMSSPSVHGPAALPGFGTLGAQVGAASVAGAAAVAGTSVGAVAGIERYRR